MQKCRVCGNTDFFKEDGYYFCQTCQTQNEDIREEVLEIRVDPTTRLRKTRIRQSRSDRSGECLGWTSWELYNFALIGLTNELIELGATADIKLTVLQLWATYLGKLEVAFTSISKKYVPKLARRFNSRDAEIIYGKLKIQKRRKRYRRSGSSTSLSMISSFQSDGSSARELNKSKKLMVAEDYKRFASSEVSIGGDSMSLNTQSAYSDRCSSVQSGTSAKSTVERLKFSSHAKLEAKKVKAIAKKVPRHKRTKYKQKYITLQYKMGPYIITPMRLWAILYIALRIHKEPIHLADMLRYGREGHLSYYKLDHLLSPEIQLTKYEANLLSQNMEITHHGMRRLIASMAKFLGVWEIVCPDFFPLISRYCEELQLPRGILRHVERIIALSPPNMKFDKNKHFFPNYEGRAMAFIIFALKILLGLDGITEYEIGSVIEQINRRFSKAECRTKELNAPSIIVHGGASEYNNSLVIEKLIGCKKAAERGYAKLVKGETAIEAVQSALWWLENDEFFNCGYGSVLNDIGNVQMDACIMDGLKFQCGSVIAISNVEHPILLARYVLENFPNRILVGRGAKELVKAANLNWLSQEDMIAPSAYLAYELLDEGNFETGVNPEIVECVKMSKKSCGTVGCVAWDGQNIAAGTTTGGLNRKMVGRIGDSAILGCGTFANQNGGCSLTGHGESILKLGVARSVVEDIEENYNPQEALKKNLDLMFEKLGQTGGGIALQKNGSWGVYFTSEMMPYVAIKDDWIMFGAELNNEKTDLYQGFHSEESCYWKYLSVNFHIDQKTQLQDLIWICNSLFYLMFFHYSTATEEGVLDSELFNFRQWQRYIECRKTVLINFHLPTRLKYSTNMSGVNSLYIRFLEFLQSKGDREEPEAINNKHVIPRELVSTMKQCIGNLMHSNIPLKEVEVFAPSLTPLHSYLQRLLEHPVHDIPSILRKNFSSTKVRYMTNCKTLMALATQYNIDMKIIDSNLHFIEKLVPYFEQTKLPSVTELKETVEVRCKDVEVDACAQTFNDYIHKKISCTININVSKQHYYDKVNKLTADIEEYNDDYAFDDILSNGKLGIINVSDSESDDDTADSKDKFISSKYNLGLSSCEKKSVNSDYIQRKTFTDRSKPVLYRNSKGRFIKPDCAEETKENNLEKINHKKLFKQTQIVNKKSLPDELLNVFSKQSSASDSDSSTSSSNDRIFCDLSDISILKENNERNKKCNTDKECRNVHKTEMKIGHFFRPFKDYWMYHCTFSRVKPKSFELFETQLPLSFRWLLNECAQTVEMSIEELYKEVCLIESCYTQILKPDSIVTENKYITIDRKSKAFRKSVLSEW